jgi:cytochrome P450
MRARLTAAAPAAATVATLAVAALALSRRAWGMAALALAAAALGPLAARVAEAAATWAALAALPGPKPVDLSQRFIGCAAALQPSLGNYMESVICVWAKTHGPIFKLRAFLRAMVVVTDPEAATWALSRAAGLAKSVEVYGGINLLSDPRGRPTLLSRPTDDPAWRAVRKAVAPAFATAALRERWPRVLAAAREAAGVVGVAAAAGKPLDVDALAAAESLQVIASVGFNIEDAGAIAAEKARVAGAAPPPPPVPGLDRAVDKLHTATRVAEQYIVKPWIAWPVARLLPSVRAGRAALSDFRTTVDAVLAAADAATPGNDGSLFARIREVCRPGGGGCGAALASEAGLIFFAGVDTSSHTLAATLALLAGHPAAGDRLAAELEGAGLLASPRARARDPAFPDLSRLPYLAACLRESMRLIPVAAGGTGRIVGAGGATLAGHKVPEGVEIWVPFYALHRSVAAWGSDASSFNPDRFLGPDPAGPDAARRFAPWSLGSRDCAGRGLAEVNLATALACLWGRFSFAFAEGKTGSVAEFEAGLEMAVTLQPAAGVWLVATERRPVVEE